MADKRAQLAAIRRKLKEQPAPQRAVSIRSESDDDPDLFRAAVAGAQKLPPDNHAEIRQPRPRPIPRAKDATLTDTPPSPPAETGNDWIPASWLREADNPPTGKQSEFAQALFGIAMLSTDKAFPERPKPHPVPLQRERDEQAALHESIYAPTSLDLHLEGGDELFHLANGVSRSLLRDLRRGRWVVQDQIDLHGCNRDEARDLLAACMGRWRKLGIRCVRVIHGKGRGSPGREPVLKKLVAGWLMNYEDVMAYCQARLPDGGAGALIVLLKATKPGPGPLL